MTVLEYQDTHTPRPPSRGFVRLTRVTYLFAGVLLPAFCFGFAALAGCPLAPEWQSGTDQAYITMMLDKTAVLPMLPLVAFSMACLTLASWNFKRFRRKNLVRAGVFGGTIISLIYTVVMWVALAPREPGMDAKTLEWFLLAAALVLIAVGIPLILLWTASKHLHITLRITGVVTGMALLIGIATFGGGMLFLLFIALGLAPAWAFAAYGILSLKLLRADQVNQKPNRILPAATAWTTAFGASMVWAVLQALHEYAKLPTAPPPGCYVATAAAKGHRHFVGAEVFSTGEKELIVNQQLRTLKAGEIALRTCLPRLHRAIRNVYDVAGPTVARRLNTPLKADIAFLLLKPPEFMVAVTLRCMGPKTVAAMNQLYRVRP